MEVPPMPDSDLDFARQLRRHDMLIDTLKGVHKKKVTPYEELILFGQLFEKNSIRSQLFDTVVLEATDAKRLPSEAEAVLAEVKIRFLEHNRESDLQRKERLQSQWMNLQTSKGEKHAAFKVKFWRAVLEMKSAQCERANC